MVAFTTWGSERGCCGHAHKTMRAAEDCIGRDHRGCASRGRHSDRVVRLIRERRELQSYDASLGPGPLRGGG
jgi:hypothetical protein